MKLRLALAAAALVALAAAGIAYSAHARSSSLVASVYGGGHHGSGCPVGGDPAFQLCFPAGVGRDFSLTAVGLGVGSGRATGTLNYGDRAGGATDVTVAIHCLRVSGGDAVVGGIVSAASDPALVGDGAVFYVSDRGDAGSTTLDAISPLLTVDLSTPGAFPGEPARFPDACPSTSSFLGTIEIEGDVSAHG